MTTLTLTPEEEALFSLPEKQSVEPTLTLEEQKMFEVAPKAEALIGEDEKTFLPEFLVQLGTDWEERSRLVEESKQDYEAGKINLAEYTLHTVGKGTAGRVLDVAGAAISGALEGISLLLPDSIEQPILSSLKDAADWALNTEAGIMATEAFNKGSAEYGKWKEANPQDAKTFESIVNVGLVFTPVKTRAKASPVPSFEQAATTMYRKAASRQKGKTFKNVKKMLMPTTPTDEMAKRTLERGFLRRGVLQLNPSEQSLVNQVRKISTVNPARSYQYNLANIVQENRKLGSELEKVLGHSKAVIAPETVAKRITTDVDSLLKNNTFLASDAQMTKAIKLNAKKAMEIIKKHPNTPVGLLKARKDFDNVLRNQMPKTFHPTSQTIFTESTKAVRQSINNLINETVPSAYVKKRLAEQSNLFRASDMLAPKAAKETSLGLGRMYQNVQRILGAKMDLNRTMAILAGASAFGVSGGLFAGFAGGLAVGGVALGIGITVTSPTVHKALAKLLKYTDKAIQKSTNPQMIKQLRLDRALVQDLIEAAAEAEQQPGEEKDKGIELSEGIKCKVEDGVWMCLYPGTDAWVTMPNNEAPDEVFSPVVKF